MIKIFVGTDRSQRLAVKVLTHSIHKHAKSEVAVESLENLIIPEPKDIRQSQRTGFSFARWALPELCNYYGKAIYLDADMLLFTDIKQLWDLCSPASTISIVDGENAKYCSSGVRLNKNETSVMIINCDKANWTLEKLVKGLDGEYNYQQMMSQLCFLDENEISRNIPRSWNSMDYWDETVNLVHYTNVPTQPWVSPDNPYGYIWIDYLKQMINENAISLHEVSQEIDHGYIRPSLMIELEGKTARVEDKEYITMLKKRDAENNYIAHREVEEWNKKRTLAIQKYEMVIAKNRGILSYLKHILMYYRSILSGKLKSI